MFLFQRRQSLCYGSDARGVCFIASIDIHCSTVLKEEACEHRHTLCYGSDGRGVCFFACEDERRLLKDFDLKWKSQQQ